MTEEEENNASQPPKKVLGFTLVPDSARWRRWWSLRWMGVSAALQTLSQSLETLTDPMRAGWSLIPAEWLAQIPAWVPAAAGWGAIGALVCAGAARMIQQRAAP